MGEANFESQGDTVIMVCRVKERAFQPGFDGNVHFEHTH
jgi:hypothetical protein